MAKPLTIKEHFEAILNYIEDGLSVKKACKKFNISHKTFYEYIKGNEDLKAQYTSAREMRGDTCLDEIEKYEKELRKGLIDAQTARVLIDTEKWKACKFYPKMYGDKQQIDYTGSVTVMPTLKVGGKELDFKVGEDARTAGDTEHTAKTSSSN